MVCKKLSLILIALIIGIGIILYFTLHNTVKHPAVKNTAGIYVDKDLLEFYKQYSTFTDPGEYEKLYTKLPESLPDLCSLIKAQLIHPFADLPKYEDVMPPDRTVDEDRYTTVKDMLAGLMKYNPAGLTNDRKPQERLILSCRYHAILLASILKHQGIPVRIRYGFASYLMPGSNVYHVICEVWNEKEKRWMLVDPDRQLIDFPRSKFEFAEDVWQQYREGKIKTDTYGVMDWYGANPILSVLCHDLASVLGNEYKYFDQPPIAADTKMDPGKIEQDKMEVLDKIAVLLKDPDKNFKELQSIYNQYDYLQFKK